MALRIGGMAIGLATVLAALGASSAPAATAPLSPGFVQVCDNALIDVTDQQAGIVSTCVSFKSDGSTISFVPAQPEGNGESHKGWLIKYYGGEVKAISATKIYVEGRVLVEGRDAAGAASKMIQIRFVANADGSREKLP